MSTSNRGEFVAFADPKVAELAAAFSEEAQAILELSPESTVHKYEGEGYSGFWKGWLRLPDEYSLVPQTNETTGAHAGALRLTARVPDIEDKKRLERPLFDYGSLGAGLAEVVLNTLHVKVSETGRHTVKVERQLKIDLGRAEGDDELLLMHRVSSNSSSVFVPHVPVDGSANTKKIVSDREVRRSEFIKSLADLEGLYSKILTHVATGKSLEDQRQTDLTGSAA